MVSHSLAAAGCLTHPFGSFAVVTLVFTMLWLDRDRLRLRTFAYAAAPYTLAGALWALYAAQAPGEFLVQFTANSAGRADDFLRPWRSLWDEIRVRFVGHYWQSNAISGRLRLTGLVVALAAIALLIAVRDLRRLPGCRLLMWLLGIRFTLLTLIANPKFEHYIVHLVPFFAMAIGIAGSYLWRQAGIEAAAGSRSPLRGPSYRSICLVVLALYFASQTGVMVHRAFIIRGYQNEYLPLIAYLKAIARPSDLIVGSSELGFGLGFYNPHLADDVWLGYWSGRHPSVVVVDRWYYGGVFEGATVRHLPAPNYFGSDFKRHSCMVKVIGGYRVYRRYDGG